MFYKKGELIGQKYEVFRLLGRGGFGVVYLVYSRESKNVYALKTFLDEYLQNDQARELFRKEVQVLIDMEAHPNLVQDFFIDDISGRLYIAMEYIAPNEFGINSLEGYLVRCPPDLAQSLQWAIQFCYGMEFIYSQGIKAHRDIKPGNVLINRQGTVKISDFGLASVFGAIKTTLQAGTQKESIGTPSHMPPEQFANAASCDERSDIYSFGIVLYQLATGGKLPFIVPLPQNNSAEETGRFWNGMYKMHVNMPVPVIDSPFSPVIRRCLEKSQQARYRSFSELRNDLEKLLKEKTGKTVNPPERKPDEPWELSNKGISLHELGSYQEALECFDKALKINPQLAAVWSNKGNTLNSLERFNEALECFDQAIKLAPDFSTAWTNKGISLEYLGKYPEALACHEKALEINPANIMNLNNKGTTLEKLGRSQEAICCFDEALNYDSKYTHALYNKGNTLMKTGNLDEAISYFNQALKVDPYMAPAYIEVGTCLGMKGQFNESIQCFDRVLEIDSKAWLAWNNKGNALNELNRSQEALKCLEKAIEINPRAPEAWSNKGRSLGQLGKISEALPCFEKAIELNPRFAMAWCNKGSCLARMEKYQDAVDCFDKALQLSPGFKLALNNKQALVSQLKQATIIREFDPIAVEWVNKGAYLVGSDPAKALNCLENAIQLEPDFNKAWYQKALSQFQLNRFREAAEAFRKFLKLTPFGLDKETNIAREILKNLEKDGIISEPAGKIDKNLLREAINLVELALSYNQKKKPDEAVRYCDKAISIFPGYTSAWFNKGYALDELGKTAEAIECYDKAIELYPQFIEAYLNKGASLSKQKKYTEADECFDKVLAVEPDRQEAWFNKGQNHFIREIFDKAAECFEKVTKLNPNIPEAWSGLGICYVELGNIDSALACLGRIDPTSLLVFGERWANSAMKLIDAGKSDAAFRLMSAAAPVNPIFSSTKVLFVRGVAAANLGRNKEAITAFQDFIEMESILPNKSEKSITEAKNRLEKLGGKPSELLAEIMSGLAEGNLLDFEKLQKIQKAQAAMLETTDVQKIIIQGHNFERAKNFEEAIKCFDRIIEMEPESQEAWNSKGNILYTLQKYEPALECYRKVTRINPGNYAAWCSQGMSLNEMKQYDKAIVCFNQALVLKPNDALSLSHKGMSYYYQKNYQEAINYFDRVLTYNQNDYFIYFIKGNCFFTLGKQLSAIDCYNKSLGLNPKFSICWYNKGNTLFDLKKNKEAAGCYKQFLLVVPAGALANEVQVAQERLKELGGL